MLFEVIEVVPLYEEPDMVDPAVEEPPFPSNFKVLIAGNSNGSWPKTQNISSQVKYLIENYEFDNVNVSYTYLIQAHRVNKKIR